MSLLLYLGGALEAEVAHILSKLDPVVGITRRCADCAEAVITAEAGVGSVAVLHEWDLRLSGVSMDVELLQCMLTVPGAPISTLDAGM